MTRQSVRQALTSVCPVLNPNPTQTRVASLWYCFRHAGLANDQRAEPHAHRLIGQGCEILPRTALRGALEEMDQTEQKAAANAAANEGGTSPAAAGGASDTAGSDSSTSDVPRGCRVGDDEGCLASGGACTTAGSVVGRPRSRGRAPASVVIAVAPDFDFDFDADFPFPSGSRDGGIRRRRRRGCRTLEERDRGEFAAAVTQPHVSRTLRLLTSMVSRSGAL